MPRPPVDRRPSGVSACRPANWSLPAAGVDLPGLALESPHLSGVGGAFGWTSAAGDWHVLLTLRTADLRQHAGQVSFPGGRIEPTDADPIAAAIREAHEEIGLAPAHVQPLGYLDPYDTISSYHVLPVVARVSPDYSLTLDPHEVADAFEVPLAYLLDSANIRIVEREYAGRLRRYHEYLHGRHHIWGATAAMLVNLRHRLEIGQ